ncbi:NAD(P)/FAD-dependent oxidoreductase [Nocardia crassostreae]|uniref:NAD(P)/FAD-dependent oxidoreductase n=1 Tax=Nocardia crassostreae TaxID=53428 RepID=UPI0008301385|nr:NAD(P)/FAD-dependent oxidoreductase [Nocardia crassostreae]
MYDVIVVGARCAGSPVAMLLARKGHRVLLVDRVTFPSDTVSTHYIHQVGVARLKEWGLLDKLVATGVTPIRRLNFSYTGITLRGFAEVEGIDEVYAPRRTVLDGLLVDAARQAVAEVIEGFTVTGLLWEDGRVIGVQGNAADGAEQEFRSAYVVGADGRNSTIGDLVEAEYHKVLPASCFVYYSYYDGLDWEFHHWTGFDLQQFGAWPTNDNQHLVTVMRKIDRFADFRTDVEGNFQQVFDQIRPDFGEQLRDSGKRVERFRAMRYPDNYYRRSAGPGWALVGDAGYHKDPFTGWGISDALIYAEVLADKLHAGLAGEQPIDEAVREYETYRDEHTADTFNFTCMISELKAPPFYETVFRAAGESELGLSRFFTLIGGGMHGKEFFAPDHLTSLYDAAGTPGADRMYPETAS